MAAMKLAVVPLPNEKNCEFVMKDGEAAPPIFFFDRSKQVAVLVALFLCALALFYTAYFAGGKRTLANAAKAAAQLAGETQRFDGRRHLKQGQLVVLDGAGSSKVRQVAAAPKEAVLLRQGNSLRALYMAGEKKYVVISENETRIVPASQIHSVVSPSAPRLAP